MRPGLAAACLAGLLAAAPALAQRNALVDRVVAVVKKDVITLSELNERVATAERELRRQGTAVPDRSVFQQQVLERMVLEKAQLQLAEETGLRVDEVQLDRAVQRIAENNNLTLAAFRQALEKDGIAFDKFREEVRQQIVLNRLRQREVDDRITVSESEIDLYLEENKLLSAGRVEYNLAHILVRVPEQASPERVEQARRRADKARAEALASKDFGAVAAAYSDGPDALQGGVIGWRAQDRLPELFAAALKAMAAGQVSEVLRSPAGFHVLKLLERRGASDAPLVEQIHARHILIKTNEVVSETEAKRRLAELRQRIVQGGEDFAQLARLHSGDASAANGGDLGWIYPGDTVPEFERAMAALKPGEVSEPVKTPFGWHLIQVLERRTADMSVDRQRLQARQALRERKADEAYEEWLRGLRDSTYIEMRLEER